MKFTGEYFVPLDQQEHNADNYYLQVEHKQRYLSILSLVKGKIILDIASGEGYGTSILSSEASQVFGVDINPDLVTHATQKYGGKNIRFLHGSADAIPLEPSSIDAVVSFETLEHISADTQQQFIREVKRVLRPDGFFIVSTPNKKNYTDRYNQTNEFHVHELYKTQFEEILNAHFGHVCVYDQGLEVTSLIMQEQDYQRQTPILPLDINHQYHFEGKYLIGICSDHQQAVQTSIASIVPESEKTYFQLMDRIVQLQQEVLELGSWGTQSAQELELARQNIVTNNEATRKLQEALAQANHENFRKESELDALQQTLILQRSYSFDLEKFTAQIADLASTLSPSSGISSKNRTATPLAEDASRDRLLQQIGQLQKDLLWYKNTYENRSLLGVIKQKIANKLGR